MQKVSKLFLFLVCLILSLMSFRPTSNKLVVYKPTKDFNFLKTYSCIYDLFDKEQWENNTGRSFDADGVHLTNGKYHPVNACHYALFCYDEYKFKGDERFKKAFIAQVKYLRDSTKYHEYDGLKVGYPYLIVFHDLKPPWYSALAQSEAISVLVRYYALTKDESILPLIVKLKNFMIAPQSDGKGTLSMTPEGHVWFEEYPNSPQERQVINGFFLSIVALYDYCNLFPDDEEAKRLYLDAINSAKASLRFYDTGSWLKYNRGDQRLVHNGYMKWQILEMKLLSNVTGDDYFKTLFMLWSVYGYEKIYETPGCKIPYYNFAVPMERNDEILKPVYIPKTVSLKSFIDNVTSNFTNDTLQLTKMFDTRNDTYVEMSGGMNSHKVNEFTLRFKEASKISGIVFSMQSNDSLDLKSISYEYYNSETKKWRNLSDVKISFTKTSLIIGFQERLINELRVKVKNLREKQFLRVSEIQLQFANNSEMPELFYYFVPIKKAEKTPITFAFQNDNFIEHKVFMKTSDDSLKVASQQWKMEEVTASNKVNINAIPNNYYELLIIARPKSALSTIDKFWWD